MFAPPWWAVVVWVDWAWSNGRTYQFYTMHTVKFDTRANLDQPVLLRAGDIVAIILGSFIVIALVIFWIQKRRGGRRWKAFG